MTTSTQLLNLRGNLIDVWNWSLWCKNEIQVLAQVFLKTPTLHAVTAETVELNMRKDIKKASFISSQRTIMKHKTSSQKRKGFKKLHWFKHELNITFFNFLRWTEEVETLRCKQSYLATSREDIRKAHTILAYCFTDSLCSLHVYTPQSTSNVLTQSGLLSFLSILAPFPKPKL